LEEQKGDNLTIYIILELMKQDLESALFAKKDASQANTTCVKTKIDLSER